MLKYPVGALLKRGSDIEIGPIRLVQPISPNRGRVKFLWAGTEHEMNLADSFVARFELFSGARVRWNADSSTLSGEVVERLAQTDTGLWIYKIRTHTTELLKEESELEPLSLVRSDPMSLLRGNIWQSMKAARRRNSFLNALEEWTRQTLGVPTLLGMRVEPMAHQLYAVRRVLGNSRPRFILADEVGLGKTIEAGLILQALMQEHPNMRVLVIAPGSMSRQWFSELFLRFGGQVFHLLEAETLMKQGKNAAAYAHERLQAGRVVVSTTALMAAPLLMRWVAEHDWDVAVLDEAHRFGKDHLLYPTLEALSTRATGFLALSATPSSKELTGMASLLALVAPDAYSESGQAALERRYAGQKGIWRALRDTIAYCAAARRESEDLDSADLEFLADIWDKAPIDDPVIPMLTAQVRGGCPASVDELVSYVQEHHRVDHRLIRTRRATLQGKRWPRRTLHALDYQPSNAELNLLKHLAELPFPDGTEAAGLRLLYERLLCVCPRHAKAFLRYRAERLGKGIPDADGHSPFKRLLQDPEPAYETTLQASLLSTVPPLPDERRWIADALGLIDDWIDDEAVPRRFRAVAGWIASHLREHPSGKILVFCQERPVVERFAAYLGDLWQASVETFHHGMADDQLSRVAQRFQSKPECQVLVSDELGGEGRNFQIATAVLHLDSPWAVSRVEQRIGRLDRIARPADKDVLSVVAVGPGDMERAVFETHRDVFRVYEQSIGGLEFALPAIQGRMIQAMCTGPDALCAIREELRGMVSRETGKADEAFESALDSSRRQLAEAESLARSLTEARASDKTPEILVKWAIRRGIEVKQQQEGWFNVVFDPERFRGPSTNLPYKTRTVFAATFQHAAAMHDETLELLGPGHRLIDFLIRDFEAEGDGRAAIAKVPVPPRHAGRIFACLTVRSAANVAEIESGLTPAMRLRVAELLPPKRMLVRRELLPFENPPVTTIADADKHLADAMFKSERAERITPEELNAIAPLGRLWDGLDLAVTQALQRFREHDTNRRSKAVEKLNEMSRFERVYLEWRQTRGDASAAAEIRAFDKARAALETPAITLDSVLLLVGVVAA